MIIDGDVTMTNIISENDNSTVLAEYTGLNRVATSFQSEYALEKELIKTLVMVNGIFSLLRLLLIKMIIL